MSKDSSSENGRAIGLKKLEVMSKNRPSAPVGTRYAFGEHGLIWLGIALFVFLLAGCGTYAASESGEMGWLGVTAFMLIVGAICVGVAKIRFKAPDTPARAVKNFYEFIARQNYKAAWAMLVVAERNPQTGSFKNFEEFRSYWKSTRKELHLRSGKLFFEDLDVGMTLSGMAVCRMTMRAEANIAYAAALGHGVRSTAMGEGGEYEIQKVLHASGGEWLMWSGQFQGADESDISWMPDQPEEFASV